MSASPVQAAEAPLTGNAASTDLFQVLCQGLELAFPLPVGGKRACESELTKGQPGTLSHLQQVARQVSAVGWEAGLWAAGMSHRF